jgi:uncharacterized protein
LYAVIMTRGPGFSALTSTASPAERVRGGSSSRVFWLRQFTNWHWISAALSLLGIAAFAVTGITLNHASDIVTHPTVRQVTAFLPPPLLAELAGIKLDRRRALPTDVAAWLDQQFRVSTAQREAEWSADEIYFTMKRPGADAWIRIDRGNGAVTHEYTRRGWIALFNDLHMGRNAGPSWSWFIDIFAGACVVFCLTGFGLLWLKAPARRSTWPLIGAGVVIPLLLAVWILH